MAGDAFDQGLRLIQQLGGQERPAVLDLFESIGEAEFGEQCVGFIYGTVYHRPGLALPERQLATVGALTALGYAPSQLQFHAKAALRVGCSREQVIEAIVQVSPVAGFPATSDALRAVREAFAGTGAEAAPAGDRYERGLSAVERVHGEAGNRVVEALQDIAPDLARYLVEFTDSEIYTRPHLSPKHREIVTLAACTALGTALPRLRAHLHQLLDVGGTQQEAVETLLHLAFYAGFPAALNAIGVAREVFAERANG
jgi:4-carboxymuconolactone decarboxylase